MKKKRIHKRLSLPAIREFREAIVSNNLGGYLVEQAEKTCAGSVIVRYTLKNRPWIVEITARRNYDFQKQRK